jgi:hypothetical protein
MKIKAKLFSSTRGLHHNHTQTHNWTLCSINCVRVECARAILPLTSKPMFEAKRSVAPGHTDHGRRTRRRNRDAIKSRGFNHAPGEREALP